LGHATRCIPIIKQLLHDNNEVILGGCNESGAILKMNFPNLLFIEFPGYSPSYSNKLGMYLSMFFQVRKFKKTIKNENKLLAKIVKDQNIDVVISDNRYGLFNSSVYSIFITHQLFIKAGVFSKYINTINHKYINKFNTCWVPDFENKSESLSGELSHGKHNLKKVEYIGPLSRFSEPLQKGDIKFKTCAIISGPEPYRTKFEKELLKKFHGSNEAYVIIRGQPYLPFKNFKNSNVNMFTHLNDQEFLEILKTSESYICRSGYSSIMDFNVLGLLDATEFIATPGQTEQLYLAKHLKNKAL
jgi:hypothetical protein